MNLKAVSRVIVIAIIAIMIAGAGVGTYLYLETARPKMKETLVIGMNADLNIFDPHKAIGLSNLGIVRLVCETLTDVDQKTFKVKPVLAESWESSAGNTKWTFHLRKGVKFHDGTPFNAEAVKYNFDRLMAPETQAGTRGIWMGTIKSMGIVDDYTLIFNTVPSPAFPAILNYPPAGMISPTQGKKLGLDFYKQPIGTGPWKFVEHIVGDHIKLVANNEYWGGAPKIKEIIAKPIVETASRIIALEAGEVDCIFFVPPHDAERLSQNSKLQVIQGIPSSNCIIQLNCQWGPLKDEKVRQALNYAVDKQAIVSKIFMGKAKVMDSWIPSSVFGYSGKAYEYDVNKARQLLADAGYPNGFEATLTYGKGTVMLDTEIVEAVQSYLSAVGVRIKIVEMDFPSFTASMRLGVANNTLRLSLCAWRVGLWMDADKGLENLRSDQWPPKGIVPLFWKNEKFDTLHDLGRTEENSDKRLEIYKQLQSIVMEEAPCIFLLFPPNTNAASAKVHGIGLRHDESILLPPDAWVEQ